jgi:DNA excision repair protein ERCC-2
MRFDLDGLDVFFPYDRIYLEQHQYMRALKQSIDAGGHCLLEMPTGTGKTVCLLSLITSYQFANPGAGKLVYCTRTVPEMNSVVEELATVLAYRAEQLDMLQEQPQQGSSEGDQDLWETKAGDAAQDDSSSAEPAAKKRRTPKKIRGTPKRGREHTMGPSATGKGAGGSGVLAVCLSSRRNMCIHERVMGESDREAVDAACRNMTASWVVETAKKNPGSMETCSYFDNFQEAGEATSMPSGVYDLEELKKWGQAQGWCPYYLTRQAINHANILVFNYQYMLDPKVAKMVSKELEAESIIVFDEAHNIDSVCIEALSVTINDRGLEQATRSLGRLSSEVSRIKSSDSQRLQQEYQNLVAGLIDQGLLAAPANDSGLASVSFIDRVLFFLTATVPIILLKNELSVSECPRSRCVERKRSGKYSASRAFHSIHEKGSRAFENPTAVGSWPQWRGPK